MAVVVVPHRETGMQSQAKQAKQAKPLKTSPPYPLPLPQAKKVALSG